MEPELPDLPMPDTASLAYSGRSVDYISGYEAGFEKAAAQMLQCYRMVVEAERERCARICDEMLAFDEDDPGKAPADHIRLGAEPGEWIEDHCKRADAVRGAAGVAACSLCNRTGPAVNEQGHWWHCDKAGCPKLAGRVPATAAPPTNAK